MQNAARLKNTKSTPRIRVRGGKSISAFVSQRKKACLPPFALSSPFIVTEETLPRESVPFMEIMTQLL